MPTPSGLTIQIMRNDFDLTLGHILSFDNNFGVRTEISGTLSNDFNIFLDQEDEITVEFVSDDMNAGMGFSMEVCNV